MSSPEDLDHASVWHEWGRITRFLESARLAFAREHALWSTLEIADLKNVAVHAPTGATSNYQVRLNQHLAAIGDEETLLASVLIHSYALAESGAADHLGVDSRDFGGIEDWGARLLASASGTWDQVLDGLAGAVEVAVVRNTYAHGTRVIDPAASTRLVEAGGPELAAGSSIAITYEDLQGYRARLKSLLRVGSVG